MQKIGVWWGVGMFWSNSFCSSSLLHRHAPKSKGRVSKAHPFASSINHYDYEMSLLDSSNKYAAVTVLIVTVCSSIWYSFVSKAVPNPYLVWPHVIKLEEVRIDFDRMKFSM
jgi:hypothetical protein